MCFSLCSETCHAFSCFSASFMIPHISTFHLLACFAISSSTTLQLSPLLFTVSPSIYNLLPLSLPHDTRPLHPASTSTLTLSITNSASLCASLAYSHLLSTPQSKTLLFISYLNKHPVSVETLCYHALALGFLCFWPR